MRCPNIAVALCAGLVCRRRRRAIFYAVTFLALANASFTLTLSKASAAQDDFAIRQIGFDYKIRSGSASISSGLAGLGDLGGYAQQWGVITVDYDSRPPWADDVNFKYYVLVEDDRAKKGMLTGEVAYVSVPKGLNHGANVFIHPNTLARYGMVKRILAEVWYQGVLADAQQWPDKSPGRWWTKVAPIKGALRTRFFTPFEHDYEVREEDIKIVLP